MTAEQNNSLHNNERPIVIMAGGLALFDAQDEDLLGLESPEHVGKVADVCLDRREVIQKCYTALQNTDYSRSFMPESSLLRQERRNMIAKQAQDIKRLEYIFESVGVVALQLELKTLLEN